MGWHLYWSWHASCYLTLPLLLYSALLGLDLHANLQSALMSWCQCSEANLSHVMLTAAIANRRSFTFRADASQPQHTTIKVGYLGFSRGFALHDSSALGLPCTPASSHYRLASLHFGRVACLPLAKTMPLAGCVRGSVLQGHIDRWSWEQRWSNAWGGLCLVNSKASQNWLAAWSWQGHPRYLIIMTVQAV